MGDSAEETQDTQDTEGTQDAQDTQDTQDTQDAQEVDLLDTGAGGENDQDTSTQETEESEFQRVETYDDGSWKDQHGTVHPPEVSESDDAERPEWLPEKFKKPEDLAEAYKQLEKKLGEKSGESSVPETYEVEVPEALGSELGEEDEKFFKEAGFSNEQAQKFLTWLSDHALPEIRAATAEAQQERLGRAWNMDPKSEGFQKRMRELRGWAESNLPEEVVNSLRKSADGVQSLYTMMQQGVGATESGGSGGGGEEVLTQAQIDSWVADPRYQTDPAFRERVENEVRRRNREK